MAEHSPRREYPLQQLAQRVEAAARRIPWIRWFGTVTSVAASAVKIRGLPPDVHLGSLLAIQGPGGERLAEVVRVDTAEAVGKLIDTGPAITIGARAYAAGELLLFPDASWKGRLIDSLGRPVDGGPPLRPGASAVNLHAAPPAAMTRTPVTRQVRSGVRVVDAFLPLCFGQRIGVFAGSGVGKSTLLAMLSKAQGFDHIVVALVGERGREVREFVDTVLGASAAQAVIVVATGDESAMMRRMAPLAATAIAEYFRDTGGNVLLVMDSVTRYAHACRDVGLAAGEPPVARGYPPSVFADLPQLLERAGPGVEGGGTITGVYSVLVDGDDHNDPVADAIRGTLDGHIVLDRAVAESGRFPAVNLLASVSRLADRAWTAEQRRAVIEMRKLVARYEDTRDLRAMGGIVAGADPEVDRAAELVPRLYAMLNQSPSDEASRDAFAEIAAALSGQG